MAGAGGAAALPIFDCLVLQLCEMYTLTSTSDPLTEPILRLPFESLSESAQAVDTLRGGTTPSLAHALSAFMMGEFSGDGAAMLEACGSALLLSFLPEAAEHFASQLCALVVRGPEDYATPLFLLAAIALRIPPAPNYVSLFKPLVLLAMGTHTDAAVGFVSAAMQASTHVEGPFSAMMISAQKHEQRPSLSKLGELPFKAGEGVVPALKQVLDTLP